ncbi:hypothetical protein [Enterococcus mundtii]
MVLTSIMIVTRRMISFTFTYREKWWISTGVFLIGYLLAIKYMYPRILFDGESILTFLFQGPYPIHNYTDYLLPYLWLLFHLFSLLFIFFPIIELLETQSIFLLIRIKSRRKLAISIFLTIIVDCFAYLLIFFSVLFFIFYSADFWSLAVIHYSFLLFSTLILLNFLATFIYFIYSNGIFSLLICMGMLVVASLVNFKFMPYKYSLILTNDIHFYLTHPTLFVVLGIQLGLLLGYLVGILFFIRRHIF